MNSVLFILSAFSVFIFSMGQNEPQYRTGSVILDKQQHQIDMVLIKYTMISLRLQQYNLN